MYLINFRHKLHLLWHKVVILLIITVVIAAVPLKAQQNDNNKIKVKGANLPNYDERFLHYGFYLAANYATYKIERSPYFKRQILDTLGASPDSVFNAVNGVGTPGFTLGFILNARLADHFDLRFVPGYSFYGRHAEFTTKSGSKVKQLNESTYSFIELPILLKFKSSRRGNTRMYIIGGIKPGFEIGAKREQQAPNTLKAQVTDFAVDYGVGFDLFYPFFKFSPELRFTHGLTNMAEPGRDIYSRSVRRMTTHTVTLYLNFE